MSLASSTLWPPFTSTAEGPRSIRALAAFFMSSSFLIDIPDSTSASGILGVISVERGMSFSL